MPNPNKRLWADNDPTKPASAARFNGMENDIELALDVPDQALADRVNNAGGIARGALNALYQALIAAGTTAQYWRGDKTWQTLDKAAVGLGSVDNTSDANKPVSSATQTALDGKSAVGHLHDASAINSGTLADARMPARLATTAQLITDWNTAVNTGWYRGSGAANAPVASTWFIGDVVSHSPIWLTQTVHAFIDDTATNTQTWRRSANDGGGGIIAWQPWYKLQLSQAEQDARYQKLLTATAPLKLTGETISADPATASAAGTMSAADKAKLDNATDQAVGGTLVSRTGAGDIDVRNAFATVAPTLTGHLTRKDYVDGLVDGAVKGTLGRKFRLIAGTIRNTGTGWFAIDDTSHRPTGVTGVTATSTSIDVAFATTAKIVSFVCGPDETYAARGLRMGASVATNAAKIFCYQENEHRVSDYVTWNGTAWSSLNSVFSGITFDGAGKITMTHEDVGTVPLSGAVSARPPAGGAANTVAFLGGMTATTTNVEIRTPAGAVITSLVNPTNLWVERAGKRKTTAAVDPATLTETSGNIWFIGVVED